MIMGKVAGVGRGRVGAGVGARVQVRVNVADVAGVRGRRRGTLDP